MSTCVACECESSILFCSRGGNNIYVSCTSCGHVYERHIENTFETDKALDKKATHHISGPKQQWDFSEIKKSQVFRPRLVKIEKYTAPGKLLDVGCSNGAFIEAANAYGWDASGVELRESSALFAQARGLTVYSQPLQDIQLAEGSFDTITLWQVLEHIPDPPDLLNECGRLLRIGGTIAFSTPNIKSIGWKLLKSDWPAIDPGCHHHLFASTTIDKVMRKCGFEKCEIETLDIQPATIKQLKKRLSGKPKSKPSNAMASLVQQSGPERMSRLLKLRKIINYPLNFTGLGEDIYGIFKKI